MKILVFIEHDIIIRHFVHSGVFSELATRHDIKFVFPPQGHRRVQLDVTRQGLCAPHRYLEIDEDRLTLWRKRFLLNQLRWRKGTHFAALRYFRRQAIGPKATAILMPFTLPGVYQLAQRWLASRLAARPNRGMRTLIEQERPDAIIHPSVLDGVFINDLTVAARDAKVPLIVIMNSWDNPSTKQAVAGYPDHMLVWGEQTKRHVIQFIGMPDDRVVRFGAAQFDVYRLSPRISRDDFCRTHDIPPHARILLYAGSSKETNEFEHLVAIDQAVTDGQLGDTVVVYRPHPWGNAGYGGERILSHPWKNVRIESSMRGYLEQISSGKKDASYPDYRQTHDLLSSVDAVVSPLSTILLEAAIHGKPVLCFLPNDEAEAVHFQLAAPMIHFEDLYAQPEFLKARGRGELLPQLRSLLSLVGDVEFAKKLKHACTYFVESFDLPYGERLVRFVESTVLGRMAPGDKADRQVA